MCNILTELDLKKIMPRADAALWIGPLNAALVEFALTTPKRQSMILAQLAHESAELTRVEENLRYSAKGLMKTWPSRFSRELALAYAGQPESIANRAYAGRNGNSEQHSGDGWRYRGRGPIQLTGRGNYIEAGAALRLDLVAEPDLLLFPVVGARVAAWFFVSKARGIEYADAGDLKANTRRINGGLNGLAERERYYARACQVLGVRL
jgi:putative chitinase